MPFSVWSDGPLAVMFCPQQKHRIVFTRLKSRNHKILWLPKEPPMADTHIAGFSGINSASQMWNVRATFVDRSRSEPEL